MAKLANEGISEVDLEGARLSLKAVDIQSRNAGRFIFDNLQAETPEDCEEARRNVAQYAKYLVEDFMRLRDAVTSKDNPQGSVVKRGLGSEISSAK